MGALISKFRALVGGFRDDTRVLLLGLDGAGKTTILYKLKLNECVTTVPTIGFNCESVDYKKLHMTIWDVGGQTRIRRLWRHYYRGTNALIFVVDANDADRLDEAAEALHAIVADDEMRGAAGVLVLANKCDLPHALTPAQLADRLAMQRVRHVKWHVQASNAVTGEGLYEGFDWLAGVVQHGK